MAPTFDIKIAERRIAESVRRMQRQRLVVEELALKGQSTDQAQKLLAEIEENLSRQIEVRGQMQTKAAGT